MPQAFGRFSQNLTLSCVCDGCNQYFCKHLELSLGRDGLEGFLRLQLGLKPAAGSRDLLNRRIHVRIAEPGPYFGAQAVFGPDAIEQTICPEPLPQVGFRRSESEPTTWILEDDLTEEVVAPYRGPGVHIRIVGGPSEAALFRIREKLRGLRIDFREQGRFDEPVTNAANTVAVGTIFRIDTSAVRAIAKIAFNYSVAALGAEMLSGADFDSARKFIRYGVVPEPFPVRVHRRPILFDDAKRGARQTNAHIVCVGWGGGKRAIVGSVSLFNELTYDVLLAPTFSGLWRDLGSGHAFDPFTKQITPLHRASFVKPPSSASAQ